MLGNKVILKLNSETGTFPRRHKAFIKASSLSEMQHPFFFKFYKFIMLYFSTFLSLPHEFSQAYYYHNYDKNDQVKRKYISIHV